MSREVRRVPLDFDFPIGETWSGYLRPADLDLPPCDACNGRGISPTGQWVNAIAMLLLMVGEDVEAQRRGRGLHPYLAELGCRPYAYVGRSHLVATPRPGPDAVEFSTGLAGREPGFMGHDSSDSWRAASKLLAAAGLPEDWGTCTTCAGTGNVGTPDQHAAHDAWEPTEHPTGDGYQLWQTVSEGGPVSPVFATSEELADWIIGSGEALHGSNTPREDLIRWVADEGSSVGSFATTSAGMVSGVELAASRGPEEG